MKVIGKEDNGCCDIPKMTKKIIQIACGNEHTGLLFEDYSVKLFGKTNYNRCKIPKLPKNIHVRSITCGGFHSGLILSDGSCLFFGLN